MSQLKIVEAIADACDDKNAENIVVLNMEHISLVADYFLICHANNERQVQAIARAVKETLAEKEIMIKHMEGFGDARWVVIDTGNIVCHLFHKDERSYYNLERLWGDASRVPLKISQEG